MHIAHHADPRSAVFCLALTAAAPPPRDAVCAFGLRLLARRIAAQV